MLHVPTQTEGIEPGTESEPSPRARLLLVDDDRSARIVLSHILQAHGFDVAQASSVAEARAQLAECVFDVVLLDLIMPDEGGLALLDELAPLSPDTVAIVLTGLQGMDPAAKALERGAYDYLRKPFTGEGLVLAIERSLHHRQRQMESRNVELRLAEAVSRHAQELGWLRLQAADARRAALRIVSGMAEAWGPDSECHLRRLSAVCREIALALPAPIRTGLGINEAYMEALSENVILHDIGQIGISGDLLLRPGPLEPDEYATVRRHPELGQRMLEQLGREIGCGGVSVPHMGAEICLAHHERFDGAGYPSGLATDEIPVSARIVSIADFYDTATHPRPYRASAFPHEVACRAVREERDGAFDPFIVDAFLRAEARIAEISRALSPTMDPASAGARAPG